MSARFQTHLLAEQHSIHSLATAPQLFLTTRLSSCMHDSRMLRAGDHDDRVVPLHSHKLTATLQHVLAGGPDAPQRNPLLTRVEVRAGHGAGADPSVSA